MPLLPFIAGLVILPLPGPSANSPNGFNLKVNEAEHRVDVTVDGKPFTAYIWPVTLKKPVLFPLVTDEGITVTRGYPLAPRPGERVDHPHHAGLWFDFGNVNGFDFWNNSEAIEAANRSKMGDVVFNKILSVQSGPDRGELDTESTWVTGQNESILDQVTRYVFARRDHARVIDQIISLKARDRVIFHDDKEGLLGIRVARWLESPTEKEGVFVDASGRSTKVAASETTEVTGAYLTSEGVKGDDAWGTRGRWCALTGRTENHTVVIAMFDHPENPGYPTYWHARGYGLFAANPLGRSIFDSRQPPFNFTIEKNQAATFRYRIVLYSGSVSVVELNREARVFAAEYK
jgi:hypothetical protein